MMPQDSQSASNVVMLFDWQRPKSGPATKNDIGDNYTGFLESVHARLQALSSMQAGWDGYDGEPVPAQIAIFAYHVLSKIWLPKLRPPDITPLSDGTLLLEWFERDSQFAIEVHAPYLISYRVSGAREREGQSTIDLSEVSQAARAFLETRAAAHG